VGSRAGETLAEVTLAVRKGLSTNALPGTTPLSDVYADGSWNAAIEDVGTKLSHPVVRAGTTVVAVGDSS